MLLPNLRAILKDRAGSIAIIFALTAPFVFGAVALAVDTIHLFRVQSMIQGIADASALAAAKELHLFGSSNEAVSEASERRTASMLAEARLFGSEHNIDATVDKLAGTARVDITVETKPLLPIAFAGMNPVRVSSRARSFGSMDLCLLALNKADGGTFRSKDVGVVAAPDCAVQSNSVHPQGLIVETGGIIIAEQICSSGGVLGPLAAFLPAPAKSDCPPISDPLTSRPEPKFGGCDYAKEFEVLAGNSTIHPGVYCGGLKISNAANVTAQPGLYVIKGGKLTTGQNATLRGENVSFYFADDSALFEFKDKSTVELSAPKTGDMAGILFFENRASKVGRAFAIGSGNVKKLLGTVYLPNAVLAIDAKGNIAADSAYTVIIARNIDLKAAKLVINADYDLTDIPKPLGLGPDSVYLEH